MNNTTQHKNTLTPKLRFKEFEGEWNVANIEEHFEFKNGLNKEKEFFGRGTPIINFTDVYHLNEIRYIYLKGLVELSENEIERYSAKRGDVFFTRTSETIHDIGMAASLVEEIPNCVFSGFVLRARPITNKLADDFKKYCFQIHPVRKEIVTKSSFTTRALTSGTLLNKVVFKFPKDKKEQQKIANFLTAVDTKLQQLTTKKEKLEQYKKGVMQQLFSQQLRFKDDDGSTFPDWEEKRLGEVGKIVSGLTYSPNDIVDEDNGVLVLRSSNVHDGKLSFEDNVYVKVDSFNPVQKDDVLICVRNGSKRLIGKNAIIDNNSVGLAFGAFMSIYRSKYNSFLFHYFGSEEYNKEVHKNLGATINSINGSDLKKFKVPFPSLKEQQKIANYLSAIDTKIDTVNTQIEKTQRFKKGLLQQMFV